MKTLSAISVVALLLPSWASAQTLQESWVKGYLTNPTLEGQRAQVRATDEQVPQALSNWRPSVQASASAGLAYQRSRIGGSTSRDTLSPTGAGVDLVQPLYQGGRTTALTERGERNVEAERARLAGTEQQLMLDIGVVFMNALRDQATVELQVNNERVIGQQLQGTRDRFSVGEVTRTDVSQAEARLARSVADRILAQGNLEVSRTAYERLVGEKPGRLTPPALPGGLPGSRDDAITGAVGNNPSVYAAGFIAQANEANVRAIDAERYPRINLRGSAGRDWESNQRNSRLDQLSLVVEAVIPLYQAGSVESRIREAKELAGQALTQIEEARRLAAEDAAANWENIVTARARIDSLQAQIAAAEVALEGVRQESVVGTRTVLDVLDAEQELLSGRVGLVTAQRDLGVAVLTLLGAVGGLTAERLQLPVEFYDPNVHYEHVRNKWTGTDTMPVVWKQGWK